MKQSKDSNMNRRQFLSKSALGVVGATAGLGLSQVLSCFPQKQRPNILIMMADDAGWHDVGYHGSEIKTPNIDKLTKEGVVLNHFYVYPTCSPTRASLLTGRPPSRFGILGPIGGRSELALPKDTLTLPALLRQNGYTTAITGKWHLGLRPEVGPRNYGFDYSYGYFHGQIDQYTHHYKNGDRSWHRNDEYVDEEGHATDLITKEAIKFIKEIRDKSKPFFLYVPFSVPHYPLQEEDRWVDPYKDTIENESRRLYAASVTHMDDAIGNILSTLDEENLAENTLVIFLSDNGGQEDWTPHGEYNNRFGPYDRLGDNTPLRDWKGSLYEGGIRVPAVLRWTGKLNPGTVDAVISVNDIYPTIAHIAGIKIPADAEIEGVDAWQAISSKGTVPDRVIYWRTGRQLAVRKGNFKLIRFGRAPKEGQDELYDVEQDPEEKHNIASEHPEIVAELKKLLEQQFSLDRKKR